jgi:uncharacterized membrane protein/uncharacterized membrane protein YphA (DoxX/SURF4 family)
MTELSKLGRFLFAIAMAGFGIQFLVHALLAGPVPGPPWSPGRPLWAYCTAVVLIVTAVCIATGRKVRLAAVLLAILLLLRALLVFAPRLVANIHDPGPWTSGFEILAMAGASLVVAGAAAELGRLLFASLLVVVGTQHFLYARFVATLVPGWIPGRLFWAVCVGVAFFAAALSIATKKSSSLAATLLGLMFFLWVFIVHLPRVVASPHDGKEWTSALVALAMCGGAWVMTSGTPLAKRR